MGLPCSRGDKPRMTTRERILLTPWEKLAGFGIIPWKFILNIALTTVVTGQILFINSQESDYLQAQSRNWFFYFFPQDYDFSDIKWNVYTVDDAIAAVQYGVSNYYQINTLSPDTYRYTQYSSVDATIPAGPTLTVVSYSDPASLSESSAPFNAATRVDYYQINGSTLGPMDPAVLSPDALRTFFRSLVSMTLMYPPLDNYAFGSSYRNCLRWSVGVSYDFTNRGSITTTMDQDVVGTCDSYASFAEQLASKAQWLNLVVILLSVLHSTLLIKGLIRTAMLLSQVRAWAETQADRLAAEAACTVAGEERAGDNTSSATSSSAPSPDLGMQNNGIRLAPMKRSNSYNRKGNKGGEGDGEGMIEMGSGLLANDSLRTGDAFTAVRRPSAVAQSTSRKGSAAGSLGSGLTFEVVTGLDGDEGGEGIMVTAVGEGTRGKAVPILGAVGSLGPLDSAAAPGADPAMLAAAAEALRVSWSSLSWRERLRFLNGWAVLSLVADICNVSSSILNLQDGAAHLPHDESRSLLVGIGASLLWIGMLRYMEHNRSMFNLVLTLRRATPRVATFLVGVLPVFVGYCLFATIVFGDRIPRFADLRTTFITLFANLNGDVVRETFMAIVAFHPITGQFFFYSFISLHIYVILNIVIAVVEESYFLTVQRTSDIEAKVAEDKAKLGLQEAEVEGKVAEEEGAAERVGPHLPTAAEPDSVSGAGAAPASDRPPLVSRPVLARGSSVRPGTGPGVLSALSLGLDPTALSPNPDMHSAKAQLSVLSSGSGSGAGKLSALLHMSEWEEVVSGVSITRNTSSVPDGQGGVAATSLGAGAIAASSRRLMASPSFRTPTQNGGRAGQPSVSSNLKPAS